MVDYYSRFWEIEKLYRSKAGAVTTIKKIKNMFSRIGIPEIVRTDNGPQFNSRQFKRFAKDWGFQYIPRVVQNIQDQIAWQKKLSGECKRG